MTEEMLFAVLTRVETLTGQDAKEDNWVIVLKGFPLGLVAGVEDVWQPLTPLSHITVDGKISLSAVRDTAPERTAALVSTHSGLHTMLYEEYILVADKGLIEYFDGKFLVLDNSLFQEYPNQSDEDYVDVDQAIGRVNPEIPENVLFELFYTNCVHANGESLVQYRNSDPADHSKILYAKLFVFAGLPELLDDADECDRPSVIFPYSEEYAIWKQRIFFGTPTDEVCVHVDMTALCLPQYQEELSILGQYCSVNGISVRLIQSRPIPKEVPRPEFAGLLRKHWDSSTFRTLSIYKAPDKNADKTPISQAAIIEDVVTQCERAAANEDFHDVFLTAPTGSGKSVLFQIPALYLAETRKLVTIVVSPLIALMNDQVDALHERGITCAACINSEMSWTQRQETMQGIECGDISILYLSPELLLSYSDVQTFIGSRTLGLLVIDEAHLVTTWGRDFRVDYWYLGTHIQRIRKYSDARFPVFALTATAVYGGPDDVVFETVEALHMRTPSLIIGNVRRDEIRFDIQHPVIGRAHEGQKVKLAANHIRSNADNGVKTIVYVPWVKQVDTIRDALPDEYKAKVGRYFSSVDKTEKRYVAEGFRSGSTPIIIATKAFGMGVDIGDIQEIYHFAPSGGLPDYVQEVGRVARTKGVSGVARTDFCEQDLKYTRILYGLSSVKQYQVRLALKKLQGLFEERQNRNMLVSVDDFAFIFGDRAESLEQSVKSCLLLLERDLVRKYTYPVVIVRPKSMFATVYACVPSAILEAFLARYGRFATHVSSISDNVRHNSSSPDSPTTDAGPIYQLELDKIWEAFFADMSFPMAKWAFFKKQLFKDLDDTWKVYPRYKLTVSLVRGPDAVMKDIVKFFDSCDAVCSKLGASYVSGRDLDAEFREYYPDPIHRKRVLNCLTNLYASTSDGPSKDIADVKSGAFVQIRGSARGDTYRLVPWDVARARHEAQREFGTMFPEESPDPKHFQKYLAADAPQSECRIKTAFLVESLALGTYQLAGGQHPQIFIRVNDPLKLKRLAVSSEYSNALVREIDDRHKRSVETMEHFFKAELTDSERWAFIEEYFLGRSTSNAPLGNAEND